METPEAVAKYNPVAEKCVALRVIAGAISRILRIPEKSLTTGEARDHFGLLSIFVGMHMSASAHKTKTQTS